MMRHPSRSHPQDEANESEQQSLLSIQRSKRDRYTFINQRTDPRTTSRRYKVLPLLFGGLIGFIGGTIVTTFGEKECVLHDVAASTALRTHEERERERVEKTRIARFSSLIYRRNISVWISYTSPKQEEHRCATTFAN